MSLLDQLKWLGKAEEIEFGEHKFRGKLAGKAWKYSQSLNGVIRTRALIFLMVISVFHPILTSYFHFDFFSMELLIERVIFSIIFLSAGFLFNKFRVISIVVSAIVLILILMGYVISETFNFRSIGFLGAVLFFILLGLYQHFKLLRIKKELEMQMIVNQSRQ